MPIYEYVCSACEHEFEQIQKFSDPALTDCPSCAVQGSVTKKLSAGAFILNGSGWYSDGYSAKNGKTGKDSKSESKPADSGGKSESKSADSGGKSESKPADSGGSGGESKVEANRGANACGHCAA